MITREIILVVEDDARVASLIQRGLEELGYTVLVAFDAENGLVQAISNAPDLIIMDVMLPGMNGLDLCRHVRAVKPGIPVLMLTALGSTDDKVEGFDSGADDYLVKPFDFRELHARIKALTGRRARGANLAGESFILAYEGIEINTRTREVKREGKEVLLTPKEYSLLEFFLKNTGRVLTRGEIAEKVWDTRFDTGTNFIDVYINYLRNKIDKGFDTKLIHTRPGVGFIFRKE